MTILLSEIRELGNDVYRLEFVDDGRSVAFEFTYYPERRRFGGNDQFSRYFEGRTSGREAFVALGTLVSGGRIVLPIEVKETGGSNLF